MLKIINGEHGLQSLSPVTNTLLSLSFKRLYVVSSYRNTAFAVLIPTKKVNNCLN